MTRWCLVPILVACSSSRPEPTAGGSSAAPAPIDAAAVASIDAAVPGDPFAGHPPRIVAPDGCTLSGAWKGQPAGLRFAPGGKPFAEVFRVDRAEATFAAASVWAELATETVRLTGFVDAARVDLHPATEFAVADWAAPGPTARLRFVAEREGMLAFDLGLPAGVTARPVRGERPCADLAIDAEAEIDPREAIAADTLDESSLVANRTIPLSLEPGRSPVARLRYRNPAAVDVLERRGKHARVAVMVTSLNPADNVIVFGWVPASAVQPNRSGYGGSWATGGDRGVPRGLPDEDSMLVTCARETPLVAELAGERRTVGVVLPGVVIEIRPGAGGELVEVRLPRVQAALGAGARWLVARAAVAGCAAAVAP